MRTSEQIDQLTKALALAHTAFDEIKRTKTVKIASERGKYDFAYAPLEAILAAVTPALSAQDLALIGGLDYEEDGSLLVLTRLAHASGQWIENRLNVGRHVDERGRMRLQDLGSAITYGRRYGITATLGIQADDDDDGNTADGNTILGTSTRGQTPVARHPTTEELTTLLDSSRAAGQSLETVSAYLRGLMALPETQKITKKFLHDTMTMDQYETARRWYGELLRQALDVDVPDHAPPPETAAVDPPSDPAAAARQDAPAPATVTVSVSTAAQTPLARKPISQLTSQECVFRLQDVLKRLVGPGNDPTTRQRRADVLTSVFGAEITTVLQATKVPKATLHLGLAGLEAMRPEAPSAVPLGQVPPGSDGPGQPSMASSAVTSAVDASEGDLHRPPSETETGDAPDAYTVHLPDEPMIVDRYVSHNDVSLLERWALEQGEAATFTHLARTLPREHGHVLMPKSRWHQIRQAVASAVEARETVQA